MMIKNFFKKKESPHSKSPVSPQLSPKVKTPGTSPVLQTIHSPQTTSPKPVKKDKEPIDIQKLWEATLSGEKDPYNRLELENFKTSLSSKSQLVLIKIVTHPTMRLRWGDRLEEAVMTFSDPDELRNIYFSTKWKDTFKELENPIPRKSNKNIFSSKSNPEDYDGEKFSTEELEEFEKELK
jgi:hypothetical protein